MAVAKSSGLITALDIGSWKVSALIAEVGEGGDIQVLGTGQRESKGVRRGYIAEKYAVLVHALYEGLAQQFIETAVKFEDGRSGSVSATLTLSDAKVFNAVERAA